MKLYAIISVPGIKDTTCLLPYNRYSCVHIHTDAHTCTSIYRTEEILFKTTSKWWRGFFYDSATFNICFVHKNYIK